MQNYKYSTRAKTTYNSINFQTNSVLDSDIKTKRKVAYAPKAKKINPVSYFLICAFWCLIFYFPCMNAWKNFIEPVYLNRVHNSHLNFDTKSVLSPTLNYATNLNLFGQNLLASVPVKGREKILTINSTGEISDLKSQIQNILNNYTKLHAGVYIYDYASGQTVEINSDEVFPSASIIKIPVLLDLFNRSKNLQLEGFEPIDLQKRLTFTEAHRTEGSGNLQFRSANINYTLDYLAKVMITQSDNSATNMLIEEVGGIDQLNTAIRHWGFSKTQITSWLPDLRGTNTTTPKDIAVMLYNIDNQKFVSMESSANIKEYMSKVENRTLIKSQVPDGAILVHKTGDIGKMLGDAGIIYAPNGKKFILSVMVKRPHNDYGARELIQKVANATYQKLGS